jgi:beta-glucanase (GH16 family)
MDMKRIIFFLTGLLFSLAMSAQFNKLVWSDEFNYNGLPDSSKWGYDVGNHGWGNNELQYYTDKRIQNVHVENGVLSIRAIKEEFNGSKFTSARLLSKNKGDWTYGRIEVKAKLPKGKGMWPAIWMLPTDWEYGGWPGSGEIDIMENVGYMPDSVFATVHTQAYNHTIGTQRSKSIYRNDLGDAFHVYAVEWTKDKIMFLMDGEKYFEFRNEKSGSKAWPFDKRFHLLLNIAVGGNWGGKMGLDESVFPQKMEVDYVRVYQ